MISLKVRVRGNPGVRPGRHSGTAWVLFSGQCRRRRNEPRGGVAVAIHRAAGPGLAEETRRLAAIRPVEAVITGGHKLPNRFVIHCLGPVYGRDEPAEKLIRSYYRRTLD